MKEHPILISGPMVRAILNGSKIQTRRVIKPQPKNEPILERPRYPDEDTYQWYDADCINSGVPIKYPYGLINDRLWVRETFRTWSQIAGEAEIEYKAGGRYIVRSEYFIPTTDGWRPSIHMPRWVSRLTLEVTNIRVEQIQEISELDAMREGAELCGHDGYHTDQFTCGFKSLWDSINVKRGYGWDSNPWVWVISFKKISSKTSNNPTQQNRENL